MQLVLGSGLGFWLSEVPRESRITESVGGVRVGFLLPGFVCKDQMCSESADIKMPKCDVDNEEGYPDT